MDNMIDLVILERKYFGQPSPNFVEQQHGLERLPSVEPSHLGSGDGYRIKIVVPEFAPACASLGVVAEVRAVGIPLAYRRTIGDDRLFRPYDNSRSEAGGTGTGVACAIRERLLRNTRGAFVLQARADMPQATLSR